MLANNTFEFDTYEQLLTELEKQLSFTVPSVTNGPVTFFQSFNKYLISQTGSAIGENWFCIYPDPTHSLSFPSPFDEIRACTDRADSSTINNFFSLFGLDARLMFQPTITLSGGERLLLSLLKAHLLSDHISNTHICSPTHWLHPNNLSIINRLVEKYETNNNQIKLYLLDGEVLDGIPNHGQEVTLTRNTFDWMLELTELVVQFPATTFPVPSPKRILNYVSSQGAFELKSPTFLIGNNGVGKSVFAKVLSGIEQALGAWQILSSNAQGSARLLFQDCVDHLFGESVMNHFDRVFRFDSSLRDNSIRLHSELVDKVKSVFNALSPKTRNITLFESDNTSTILEIKIALIAERLASNPPLLILDEPSWCLSKNVARSLMASVFEIAHKRKTAVLVISHNLQWFSDMAGDILTLSRLKDDKISLEMTTNK